MGEGYLEQPQTAYDRVKYPSALYRTTHPEHLAALARLHGLAAADPRHARTLEIAGGDGLNVLAMGAALPDARFVSIDLATVPVARGRALAAAAGMTNVRIEAADIIEAAESFAGEFDYVVAHGLYAWVPPAVQEATLRLIDRVLAPEGVSFISYNALPGCHLRMAVREMLAYELDGMAQGADRMRQARAILQDFARARQGDGPSETALRDTARLMLDKNPDSLFHDELGECYYPKALHQMAAEAAQHNLAYLTESQAGGLFHGLPGEDIDDGAVVRRAQTADFRDVCFFHQSLFVRPGRNPRRVADPALVGTLLAGTASGLRRASDTLFTVGKGEFEVGDARLASFLEETIRAVPARLPLAWVAEAPEYCEPILQLVNRGILELHSLPFPGTLQPGEHPRAHALLHALIAEGETRLFSLDHRLMDIPEEGPRRFLSLLDGTRDRAALAAEWEAAGMATMVSAETALAQLARAGMLSE